MEMKLCKVEVLLRKRRIRSGDYVEYHPRPGKYVTKREETGSKPEVIETDLTQKWILHDFNLEKKMFSIATEYPVNQLTLTGSMGFEKGPEVMDAICRECYSIPRMDIFARSMTLADRNARLALVPFENMKRYAFYPFGSEVAGQIEHNGKFYEKMAHHAKTARFYSHDGGGVERTDENGIRYREPTNENPVFVTETYYYHYSKVENYLGSYWLATQCCMLSEASAIFNMRYVHGGSVRAKALEYSSAFSCEGCFKLRPIVSFSTDLMLDVSDESRDGSSPEKAWRFLF